MANILASYRAKKANSLANPITNAVPFNQADSSTTIAGCYFPQISGTTSAAFRARAYGRFTTGTSGNAACSFQFGNSTAASTNTVVCAPTTQTCAANCSWFLEAIFTWDATSKILQNIYTAINGSTFALVVYVAGTAATGVDLSTGAAGNALVPAALFGTSNAGNIAYLDDMVLEVL